MDKQIESMDVVRITPQEPQGEIENEENLKEQKWNHKDLIDIAMRIENDLLIIKICILFFAVLTVIGLTGILIFIFL